MAYTTIPSGGLAVKDPADSRSFCFDWDASNLGSTVQIVTSTFTVTSFAGDAVPALTKDSEAKLTASEATSALGRTVTVDNRVTRLRLTGGALGSQWLVANTIITNTSPAETKERSFTLIVEDQ